MAIKLFLKRFRMTIYDALLETLKIWPHIKFYFISQSRMSGSDLCIDKCKVS